MTECSFCGEEFEDDIELHLHWGESHGDELNSHQKEKVKKAERKKQERKEKKRSERKKMAGIGLAVVGALALVGLTASQLMSGGNTPQNTAQISVEGEPVLGSPDANVTVVEFGDVQCPYCARFDQGAFQRLKTEYIDSGNVKFVWKDYPLTEIGHDWARPAAEALECVYREDGDEAFYSVKSQVFENQDSMSQANAYSQVKAFAEEENVSAEAVQQCISSGDARSEVMQDKREGSNSGVTGTPTVFVNGKQVEARYSSIKAAVEQQLR